MGVQGRPEGGGESLELRIKIKIIRISVSLLPDAHDLRAHALHTPLSTLGEPLAVLTFPMRNLRLGGVKESAQEPAGQ